MNTTANRVWTNYLETRRQQKTSASNLALRDAEKQQTEVGHHNEGKNIIYEQVTLQSSQNPPN